jgi:hypothetical protein
VSKKPRLGGAYSTVTELKGARQRLRQVGGAKSAECSIAWGVTWWLPSTGTISAIRRAQYGQGAKA